MSRTGVGRGCFSGVEYFVALKWNADRGCACFVGGGRWNLFDFCACADTVTLREKFTVCEGGWLDGAGKGCDEGHHYLSLGVRHGGFVSRCCPSGR